MTETPEQSDDIPAVLRDAIKRYERWATNLTVGEPPAVINKTLYHYTDGQGLRGILESGKIWFTEYRHLNEPSELLHGIRIALEAATALVGQYDGRVQLFLRFSTDMIRAAKLATTLEFFIASCSQRRDTLSQWRA